MNKENGQPILTLAIPTFNRLDCLRLLVDTSIRQTISAGILGKNFEIMIVNNNSNDGTADYLNGLTDIKGVRVVHQSHNIGLGGNILYSYQEAKSKYVWVMGDDDVPLDGAIIAVMECLERDQPDLLYLPSRGVAGDLSELAKGKVESTGVKVLDGMSLAIQSSVYVTFISSWVVNKEAYLSLTCNARIDRYRNTFLPHLEWIFSLLVEGKKFICANGIWVIARASSSGGYSVFEAFSVQYNRIVDEKLADRPLLHRYFRYCMLWCFIPGLVWGIRQNTIGKFDQFDKRKAMSILKFTYGNDLFFILIVAPIIHLNKPGAWCFRQIARLLEKGWLYLWKRRVPKHHSAI